jgi:hypothetical protein
MMTKKTKKDDEIYILGSEIRPEKGKINVGTKWIVFSICIAALLLTGIVVYMTSKDDEKKIEYYFEPEETLPQSITVETIDLDNTNQKGYFETYEETINEVTLRIHIPHHATMSLELGMPDKSDSTIIFTTQAADIRADNKRIVGEFVLEGKQLAKGIAKRGFCAVIDNTISIGTGDETPLLQQAIDNIGFFFRQYPLVHNGVIVPNNPVNSSIRRALAVCNEQIVMIESQETVTFQDFSQALVEIGVSDAIYLVGGRNTYGWYYTQDAVRHEFGSEQSNLPPYTSFIVWRTQ